MRKTLPALCLCVLSAIARAQEPKAPEFRLDAAAAPRAYDLRLAIDPRETSFEGEVRIEMHIAHGIPVLWLNAEKLEILSARFTLAEREIPVRVVTAPADFVGFAAEGGFPAGDLVAEIRYRAAIEGVATRGIFRQKEGEEWYVVSQFEAMNARRAIPSFDQPGWKVPWRVTIDAPAADRAVTNTPEVSVSEIGDRPGWKRHVFAPTKPLPTYLVALAVGPFDLVDGGLAGVRPTPLRYVVPKGRGDEARFARESSPRILALLEDYFGEPYPFEKLDAVTIPATFGFGAMENAGMITYSSEILLALPRGESLDFKRRYASIGAHEMAHMWFGDLVTLAWWDDVWLNESFATWMARKTLRAYRPEWAGGWREGNQRRRAIYADRLMSARRVANAVANKSDISAAFDAITYSKGGEVLSMFEAWLGPERFRAGVRRFLKEHAYGNATSQDFFRALGEASGRGPSAVAAFRSFVGQPGLPMVDVRLECTAAGAAIEVSQQRFKPRGTEGADGQWTTPACFRYESGGRLHKQCAEITGRHTIALAEAKACPRWVVGNADGAGHWIARYPTATLKALALRVPELPEAEAVALAYDTWLMMDSGLLDRDAAFMLTEGFLRHKSLGVRRGGVELLENVRDEWLDATQRRRVHALAARRLLAMAREIGWNERKGDPVGVHDLRELLLPYLARLDAGKGLRREARSLALRWLDDREAVAASALPAVLRTAARFSDAATFARMEQAMSSARNRNDRSQLIKALAVVREPALRDRALSLLLARSGETATLDGREAYTFLEMALEDNFNRGTAFEHLRGHWDALQAKLPAESVARLLRRLPGLCTRAERDAYVAFFKERAPGHLGGRLAYEQTLEAIEICITSNARDPG